MIFMNTLYINGKSLTLEHVADVAFDDTIKVSILPEQVDFIQAGADYVQEIIQSGKTVYGINTGFGSLSSISIDEADLSQLQHNLVISHAAGTGDLLPESSVRAMMLLRANTLSKGFSGARVKLIEQLLNYLNLGIHPCVPCQGSLGASGDLAPLAYLALPLIGLGEVFYQGQKMLTVAALKQTNLIPISWAAKEGLALTNGTQMMNAIGALTLLEAEKLLALANLSAALSVEGFRASHAPFDPDVHQLRPHLGQIECAKMIQNYLVESEIESSHQNCKKVQDPYSFRCIPQVHGAVFDTLAQVRKTLEIEINSATDNPLVFSEQKKVVAQGNFHGEPIAMVLDHLAIALAELGNIAERRIDKLCDPNFSELPAFLSQGKVGLNSGVMIAQYTAASLVSENKILCHPAVVDSVPSSNNKEDHVSMGAIAARKAAKVLEHVKHIIATEYFCSVQALHCNQPLKAGKALQLVYQHLGKQFKPLIEDRLFVLEIEKFKQTQMMTDFYSQFIKN